MVSLLMLFHFCDLFKSHPEIRSLFKDGRQAFCQNNRKQEFEFVADGSGGGLRLRRHNMKPDSPSKSKACRFHSATGWEYPRTSIRQIVHISSRYQRAVAEEFEVVL